MEATNPSDFSPEAKSLELETVRNAPEFRGESTRRKMQRQVLTILVEGQRCSQKDIADRLGLAWTQEDEEKRVMDRVRHLCKEVRKMLEDHYRSANKIEGDICIVFPKPATNDVYAGAYYCEYKKFPAIYEVQALSMFWRQVARDVKNCHLDRIEIYFSNEDAEFGPKHNHIGDYSGSGEPVAGYYLGRTFEALGLSASLMRSRLLTAEVTAQPMRKFGFLGSSLAIQRLRRLRQLPDWRNCQRFYFDWEKESQDAGDHLEGVVIDSHTSKRYFAKTEGDFLIDWAVVSYIFNRERNQYLYQMAGITSAGTEAAAQFLTRESDVKTIFERLGTGDNCKLMSFEALLKVGVQDNTPVWTAIEVFYDPARQNSKPRGT